MAEINLAQKDGFLVALIAHDGTNWQKVLVDSGGRLQVEQLAALPAGDNNIGNVDVVTMPTTTVQSKDGDKVLGFESVVGREFSDTDLDAGTNSVSDSAVPSGKVWKLTFLQMQYTGTVPSVIYVRVIGLANDIELLYKASPASAIWYTWSGDIYLDAGDYINIVVGAATAGDDIKVKYVGVEMNAP